MMHNDNRFPQVPKMIADSLKASRDRATLIFDEIKKAREKSDTQGLVDMGIEKPASLNQLIAEAKRVQGIVTGVFAALEAC